MAELATIARPYAEALFKAAGVDDQVRLAEQVQALGDALGNAQLRHFADSPQASAEQVFELITAVANTPISDPAKNLLRLVIDNGRLAAMPEIASQFHVLVSASSGVSDAVIHSAYPIETEQLTDLLPTLEKRFGRKLNATVVLAPELIGGVRVVVGDEVLDTSVKARLEQMRAALTA